MFAHAAPGAVELVAQVLQHHAPVQAGDAGDVLGAVAATVGVEVEAKLDLLIVSDRGLHGVLVATVVVSVVLPVVVVTLLGSVVGKLLLVGRCAPGRQRVSDVGEGSLYFRHVEGWLVQAESLSIFVDTANVSLGAKLGRG